MKMKMNNFQMEFVILFICIILTGCPGPPNIYFYKYWHKPGEDEIGVKRALLECGAKDTLRDPLEFSLYSKPRNHKHEEHNQEVMDYAGNIHTCMNAHGFFYLDRRTIILKRPRYYHWTMCDPSTYRPMPTVCSEIMTRNTERRLNSDYCKTRIGPTPPECSP